MSSARMRTMLGGPGGGEGEGAAAVGAAGGVPPPHPPRASTASPRIVATRNRMRPDDGKDGEPDGMVADSPRAVAQAAIRAPGVPASAHGGIVWGKRLPPGGGAMPPSRLSRRAPTRRRPARIRRSSIAGTGGGYRNTGRGGPGGEARPSPGSSPPGTPDLRGGVEVTATTGPVSDAIERLQGQHREIAALL